MWRKIQYVLIFLVLIGVTIVLVADAVYKGLTKDYYICEKCDNKHYPKLEGKGEQYTEIWLCKKCESILNFEAGIALNLGNYETDGYEEKSTARRKWIYEEAKR